MPLKKKDESDYSQGVAQSKVHPLYNDEKADITLVSDDGVQFKVHSYYLKAMSPRSSVFRDMLHITSTSSNIEIDRPAKVLLLFLDYVCKDEPPVLLNEIADYEPIINLARRFACNRVIERIKLVALCLLYEKAFAFRVFCIASRLDDVRLAKCAVRQFCHISHSFVRPDKISVDAAKKCSLPYLLGLYRAMAVAEQLHSGEHEVDWVKVAAKFSPAA
ncbi:hypothetical protein CI109_106905 [Kwoniella shandongensis]|uniref:Uncharacterized protein n=1 Tax=Kwoniella shandongensis TaxID=1734106 RepID=A0A5M6C7J6_9TREE|nr:uncharacterized protein CI109_000840 [Kwoniella shandongensis]KAA5530660.1 hypothetical protein CI109_000840 [Kwoniella shandongensis]